MKHAMLDVLVMISMIGFFTLNGYGADLMAPPKEGADPTAILLVEQGIKQSNEGQWEEAGASFKLASQIDPNLSSATFNAGVAALELGRKEEALNHMERFVSRQPDNQEGQRLLSDIRESVDNVYPAAGRGFAEFGLASLLGFIFVFAMAAYDIGVTHPFQKETGLEEVKRREPLRKAA
ncbi:MAG: hypothetical protein LLH30_05270 [Candidatus Manganitrophus sp. SA1]|nr:hypothetical protein [Candidatus Manganitrophus morganii]